MAKTLRQIIEKGIHDADASPQSDTNPEAAMNRITVLRNALAEALAHLENWEYEAEELRRAAWAVARNELVEMIDKHRA